MRIHVLSDLHLEFADFAMPEVQADVRVLAGDINTKDRGVVFAKDHSSQIPTIYVAGNHEFYGGAIPKLYENLKSAALGSQVSVLQNDELIVGDVRFLGCTLWTDFGVCGDESRELAMIEAKLVMNDYRKIRNNPTYRKLTPHETYRLHRCSLQWLIERLNSPFGGKTVVITHHAPSGKSLADPNDLISTAYCSDLEQLIGESSIDLWIHGHTHRCVDYTISGTRILSNQRGYPGECPDGFDPELVISI